MLQAALQQSLIETIIDLKNEINAKADKLLQLLGADLAVEEKHEGSLSTKLAGNHLDFGVRLTVQDYTADIEANKSMPVGLFNNKSRTQLDAGLTAQPSVRQKSRRPSFQSNEPTPNNASYFPEVNLAELNARPRGESQFELFREKKAESSSLPSHSGTYASLQSENSADMSSQDVVGASVIRIDFEGRGRSQSLKGSTNQSSNLIQRGRQFSVQKKATVLVKLGDSIAPVPTNQSLHSEFEHETSDAAKEASNPARSSVLAVLGRVKSTGKGAKLQTGNSFRKRNPIIGESILTTINQSTQSFDQAPLAPKKGVQAETLTPRENLQTGTLSPREDFQVEILTPREDVQAETLTPGEGVQAEKVIINETTHFESLDSLTANPSCSGSIAQLDEFILTMKTATEVESRSATLKPKIIKLQQFNELPDSNVRDIRSVKVPQKSISRRVMHTSAISQPSIKSQRSVVTSLPRPDENIRHNPQKMPRSPWLYDLFLFLFLIPAFDSRGQAITIDQFGAEDFDGISFQACGFHPKSYFNSIWDFVMSLLYFACLSIIPFIIGFKDDMPPVYYLIMNLAVTGIFTIDLFVTIMTPQPKKANIICTFREYESMRPTLKDWVKRWVVREFVLDMLAVFPFEYVLDFWQYSPLLFLMRLIRVRQLPLLISRCPIYAMLKTFLDETFGGGVSQVMPLAIIILIYSHYNACAIYYFGKIEGFLGWNLVWMKFDGATVAQLYTWTFFQALGNMFPMSFKPNTASEQWVAIIFIVFGAILYAVFVGYVSSAAMSINTSGRLYHQKIEELIDYMKWKNLNAVTRKKLISYYETKYRGKYFEEDHLLADMNESLRTEIQLHNTRVLIEKVPFLRREEKDNRDDIFFARIASVLHACYFIPGDCITRQGDSGLDMYFILSGKVDVFISSRKVVSLYDGAYFGEVALIRRVLRTATVQAAMSCCLYRLTYSDFHSVINDFPDMRARMDMLAKERSTLSRKREGIIMQLNQ